MGVLSVTACLAPPEILMAAPAVLLFRVLWLLPDWLHKWRCLVERPPVMLLCSACATSGGAYPSRETPVADNRRSCDADELCAHCGRR
jgi:hypothetical protein